MTFKNMKEILLTVAPAYGETMIGNLLNQSNRAFTGETRILPMNKRILEFGATPTYTAKTAAELINLQNRVIIAGNNTVLDGAVLPDDVYAIYRVDFYNSDKVLLSDTYSMPWVYEHKNLFLGVSGATEIASGVDAIVLNYFSQGYNLNDSDEPLYPAEYHMAPVFNTISTLKVLLGDSPGAAAADAKYQQIRREAKRYANTSGDASQGEVIQRDF